MHEHRDIDILQMPLEGVAAYWLALKKLAGNKRNLKVLQEEAQHTPEPFVRHLLEICFGSMSESRIRILAKAREETVLSEVERRYDLMRIALLDIAQSENPRKSMAKMAARFPRSPLTEQRALTLAHELIKLIPERGAVNDHYFDVSHRQQDDKLMVTLLFYVLLARKEGKDACQPYLPIISSYYFVDGLALVIDGMDVPFVRKWLREHKMVLLRDVQDKMRMSTELCLGIRDRLDYDDVFRIARSWMR